MSIKSITRRWGPQIRFYLSASNNLLFLAYYKYLYKPKANTISAFLDAYSKLQKGAITVIQVGANDGINHDPISKYIKRDGWHGVLLEPQRYVHDHYLRKVYAKYSSIKTICAAIGAEDGYSTLYKIGWCDMRWATGLASFQKEKIEYAYTSGLVDRACTKNNLQLPSDKSQYIVEERVKVISVPTLLSKYDLETISLLQIDTEGFDFEVIKLFDIAKNKPTAIVFENMHLSALDRSACTRHLETNGYHNKEYGANTLALHKTIHQSLLAFIQ